MPIERVRPWTGAAEDAAAGAFWKRMRLLEVDCSTVGCRSLVGVPKAVSEAVEIVSVQPQPKGLAAAPCRV